MPALLPEPPAASQRPLRTEREMRLQELQAEVAAEKDPHVAQRTLLTVAGYHAGDGTWAEAQKIYEDLAVSPFAEVRHAALRNLQVVQRNVALAAETDLARREWLQLELAALHQSFGHEKAAKTMLRSLQVNAMQEPIRQQASQRLADYAAPSLPILPKPSAGAN
ncbi:MAG: hypothetical protein ACO1TE_24375 [Prosthecobacter sp.]